jgi:hypothetical protein
MSQYFEQDFENALRGFQQIFSQDPEDHTVKSFMKNALKYYNTGVPENWTGAEEMVNK